MRFKKIIFALFLAIFLNLVCVDVFANISGTGGIGGSGGTINNNGGEHYYKRYGFFVAVYNKNNAQRGSTKDYVVRNDQGVKIDSLENWFKISGTTITTDPKVLYKYLGIPYTGFEGKYAGIKKIIKEMGVTLSEDDYVVVEPYTVIGNYKYTFRDIISKQYKVNGWPFYENYKVAAMLLANSAKVGKTITVGGNKYTAPSGNCTATNYTNLIRKIKNFVDIPAINI